jgi:quinoprotein glucose dehydrogenase
VALDAATGEMLWMHSENEGARGAAAPRQLSGRGLAYWSDGASDDRILYVTPGYRLIALNARTGVPVASFGEKGVVDLKKDDDQEMDLVTGEIGLHSTPTVARNVVIIGAAHKTGGNPKSRRNEKGYVRGFDVRTGKRLWIFHTIPQAGEFGNDSWEKDSWSYTGNTGVWGQISADEELGLVYLPVELPTGDYYGGHRPGNGLFGESLVAVDLQTGKRRWHYQLVHHGIWDMDIPCAPILVDLVVNGRPVKAVAQPTKQAFLYVFNRETGEPIWPIEERPVPQSDMPGEQSWPTQPFPTNPPPHARQSFGIADISPYLPDEESTRFKARLLAAKNLGLFTPITYSDTVHVPASNGGVLFGGMASEPATGAVYVVTHDNPGILRLVRPGETLGRDGPPQPPGQVVYRQNCQSCHGPDRLGSDSVPALVHAATDPANNIAGAARFDAAAIRTVIAAGKGRMPSFPHLAPADVDALVALLTTAAGGRDSGAAGRGRGSPVSSGAPPTLIVGAGSAWARPETPAGRGRGAPPPYPDGVRQYERPVINEYNTVGNRIAPPFTSIVKYDLNVPAIKWRIGFGDDPELAARGMTGTGAPGLLNGVIVTASGLLFGAGRDNQIRAWDSDTGVQLWASRFGGEFVGSPVMYEIAGRQYLLVPAADTPPRGAGSGAAAPLGWVAYALPRN